MSCLIKRVVPFVLTFVVGLGLAALLGTWQTRSWRHHYGENVLLMPMSGEAPYQRGWMKRKCRPEARAWSIPEERVWSAPTVDQNSPLNPNPAPVRVISYSNLSTPDGEPVTRDAVITNLPTPRFWTMATEHGERVAPFDHMVRVTLNASGKVGEIETVYSQSTDFVGGGNFKPAYSVDDVMAAAHGIQFRPAMRGSVPVSQQVTILYRQE